MLSPLMHGQQGKKIRAGANPRIGVVPGPNGPKKGLPCKEPFGGPKKEEKVGTNLFLKRT